MSRPSDRENYKETKGEKTIRIFVAIFYFIQTVLTTFPFMRGLDENGNIREMTAFEIAVQPEGYATAAEIKIAIIFALLVVLPIVCFFFYVLDKSNIKGMVSFATCVINVSIITFSVGGAIAMGAVVTLLLYVLIMFLTVQGMLLHAKNTM